MTFNLPPKLAAFLSILALFVSAVAVTISIDDDGTVHVDATLTRPQSAEKKIDVRVPGPDKTITIDADNQVDPTEQQEHLSPEIGEGVDLHEDARDEVPPGVTVEQVERGLDRTDALADQTLRKPVEPAGAQAYSCQPAYVVNQSALNARRVGVALHFTVSPPGSLLAIRGLFNTPSFGASSNAGIELSGRCQLWVPFDRKGWAQGAANSAYYSIEIVTYDLTRAQWLAAPIIQRGILASFVADLLKRIGAPPRLVDPVGCIWPAGVTDHDRLECGNNHWDVGPSFPFDVFMGQVRRAYRGANVSGHTRYLTKRELTITRRRCKYPKRLRPFRLARAQKVKLTRLGTYGVRHRGQRRKRMAQAERLSAKDRKALC